MPQPPPPRVDLGSDLSPAAQLRRHFALLIADRRLLPGDRLPGLRSVAAGAGVSINTVRAAYARLEADGLVATRQGVGTTVCPVGLAGLAAGGTTDLSPGTIGVLVAGLDPFYLPILEGIVAATDREGAVTLIATAENQPERAALAMRQMAARGVGGFIVLSADTERIPPDALPLVHVDCPDRAGYRIDLDAARAGRLLGEHLVAHGHCQVGLVTAPVAWPNMAGLAAGLRASTGAAGAGLVVAEVPGFFSDHGRRGLGDLLATSPRPTAVVTAGAMQALGVMEEALGRGLRIPGDLAVVGYGDAAPARYGSPPVTMVGFAEREIGARAADMVLRLIAGKRVSPRQVVVPPELRVRASCGCRWARAPGRGGGPLG